MRTSFLAVTVAIVPALATSLMAQVVGPARRAAAIAGDAVAAPGVGDRIETREVQRDAARQNARANAIADADRWRYTYHKNQWWYYTPKQSWMHYRNNNWSNYDPATYTNPRYTTGYRGYRVPRRQAIAPFSNGSAAGNFGSRLGADVGAAANGGVGENEGAALGGAIGNTVNAARNALPAIPPAVTPPNSTP
jgi:hypothetical protein